MAQKKNLTALQKRELERLRSQHSANNPAICCVIEQEDVSIAEELRQAGALEFIRQRGIQSKNPYGGFTYRTYKVVA